MPVRPYTQTGARDAPARMTEPLRGSRIEIPSDARRPRYRPISDYGLIGNTHTAALVSTEGAIDWCCLPHFDSPAVFLRILDAEQGGYFQICPIGRFGSRREYVSDSAILATTFTTRTGAMRLVDFMHAQAIAVSRLGVDLAHCHRLLRLVEGVAGHVDFEIRFAPTFDFARPPTHVALRPGWAIARGGGDGAVLELPGDTVLTRASDGAYTARLRVHAGERRWFVLSHGAGGDVPARVDPEGLLAETRDNWARWSSECTYDGPYAELVRGSARVLKLLTFGPTGAVIAAPTTSLPEHVGGLRNWDYRFAWLRDASMILRALIALGYHTSAMDFLQWLEGLWSSDGSWLQIMYSIRGERELPERALDHLDGYRGSRPVRVGNGAASQHQLDVYGHVLDAAWVCSRTMAPIDAGLWRVLRHFTDEAARRWREPDHGIWEVRGATQHFMSSKLLCWVALDRALRLVAADARLEGDVARWRADRAAIRRAIEDTGFHRNSGVFAQTLGGAALDASALLVPIVGFLPANDPRMRSTIAAIAQRLAPDGLVYRYVDDDGLPGHEASFALCTFWLVENLALLGDVDRACALFEHVTRYANDLGLMSEEIARDGALLGNYPQGFTHLGVIHAALAIAGSRHVARGPRR